MKNKWAMALIIVVILLLAFAAGASAATDWQGIVLKDNRSIDIYCVGDELLVTVYSDVDMTVTCRTWVREE